MNKTIKLHLVSLWWLLNRSRDCLWAFSSFQMERTNSTSTDSSAHHGGPSFLDDLSHAVINDSWWKWRNCLLWCLGVYQWQCWCFCDFQVFSVFSLFQSWPLKGLDWGGTFLSPVGVLGHHYKSIWKRPGEETKIWLDLLFLQEEKGKLKLSPSCFSRKNKESHHVRLI